MLSQTEVSESSSCNPAPLTKALRGLHLALLASACVVTNVLPASAQSQPTAPQIDQPATTDGQLDDIVVTASEDDPVGWQGAPEWVYETPRAISVIGRDEIKTSSERSVIDLFDSVSGVAVAGRRQDPGISVNIRGLQDFNRVNVMIDGARQNYQKANHEEPGRFYIEPAFVRQVEIEKSATSGLGGAGALGGTVNFRTLNANDLIQGTNSYGLEGKLSSGSNAYFFNGNVAAGIRLNENMSFVAGVSRKRLGDYDVGKNGTLKTNNDTAKGNELIHTGSQAMSWFSKLNVDFNEDHSLTLGAIGYHDSFSLSTTKDTERTDSDLLNLTGTATYQWRPANDLIDIEAALWANRTHNNQYRYARSSYGSFDVDVAMNTYGGSIQNTSNFDFSFGSLSWNHGVEAFRDIGRRKRTGEGTSKDPNDVWFGADPNGTRNVLSAFNQLSFNHNDFVELSAGLRYDHFRVSGKSKVLTEVSNTGAFNYLEGQYENSGGRFSPTFSLAVNPIEGLQLFGKYSDGYRTPTIMETLLGGQHISNGSLFQPNPDLRPEIAQTWEGGVNINFDEVFSKNDRFRAKLSWFTRTVENFVAQGNTDLFIKLPHSPDPQAYESVQYVNLLDHVKMQGIEVEAFYDAGIVFGGLTFSRTLTELPKDGRYDNKWIYTGADFDSSVLLVNVAPETKLSVDAGVRLLDEKLTLGSRLTHVKPKDQAGGFARGYKPKEYTLIDVYGSYELHENASLRVNVDNIADIAYVDALSISGYPSPGRTVTASLNFNF